jgi:hypothetical protein
MGRIPLFCFFDNTLNTIVNNKDRNNKMIAEMTLELYFFFKVISHRAGIIPPNIRSSMDIGD